MSPLPVKLSMYCQDLSYNIQMILKRRAQKPAQHTNSKTNVWTSDHDVIVLFSPPLYIW